MSLTADIGIIGGSGVYDPKLFEKEGTYHEMTPYGKTSAPIDVGLLKGVKVAFLARHGKHHEYPPHTVNYRANIYALKQLGVKAIIATAAVGSLKAELPPGKLVIADQFIDFTKLRHYTFFDEGHTHHVSLADPFCESLRQVFIQQAEAAELDFASQGTYVCIEGPRFSTRAESHMFRQFADIIGMTLVPECQLAREMEICYVGLASVTDFDVWADKPVDVQEVLAVMKQNLENLKLLIQNCLSEIPAPESRSCGCQEALKFAKV